MTLTDQQIDEALALCEKATPEPWDVRPDPGADCDECGEPLPEYPCMVTHNGAAIAFLDFDNREEANAAFIAASRTGWPEALRELKALRAEHNLALKMLLAVAENKEASRKATDPRKET